MITEIDAQVEVVEFHQPTGKLIALQIKTGHSYFRKHGEDYVFHGKQRHLDYWTNHSLPVFLILHDPDRNLTIWQKVERHLVEVNAKGWSIVVPAANVLSTESKEFFAAGIASNEQSIRRLSMATEIWAIVGVENSPLCFWSVASVASGWNDGGEIAEIEFDDGVEGFCGGSLAEAVG